ncbi:MAG TPA: LLM class flavin-dependent oxidoreductase [Ktedonobacteraceae bacterium]|nr:LLM class flavin-dependent oxidoreductase [Ktedonobacteraceae bacterium]
MRIGINMAWHNWQDILRMARAADEYGFDSIGFLDHYHSHILEQDYLCGWSMYGALAMATSRIHFVPMVIDRMNYLPGVLAKETSTLSIISDGRFELGIGAGDYFEEARAWGLPVPPAAERIAGLRETVEALRQVWRGENTTFEGAYIHLKDAACVPAPPAPPRVVVGIGNSKRLLSDAVQYADELNVYSDDDFIALAQQAIEASGRNVTLSTLVWGLRDDLADKLPAWETMGVTRTFVSLWKLEEQLAQLARLL